jgi:hypothetical protein
MHGMCLFAFLALMLTSCSKSRPPARDQAPGIGRAGAASTIAGSPAAGSGEPSAPVQLSKHDCARTEYPDDYVLPEGTLCRTHADCGSLGKCVGIPRERCEYDDGPDLASDTCQEDADCTLGSNGRCPRVFETALCVYEECVTDADCVLGANCVCSERSGYDHTCVVAGCDDSRCAAGQQCKEDESVGGVPPEWNWHCTTDRDECASMDECAPNDVTREWCGYDYARQLWTCQGFILVD